MINAASSFASKGDTVLVSAKKLFFYIKQKFDRNLIALSIPVRV